MQVDLECTLNIQGGRKFTPAEQILRTLRKVHNLKMGHEMYLSISYLQEYILVICKICVELSDLLHSKQITKGKEQPKNQRV